MKRQLADGLILRTLSEGHAGDREQLPQFYADVNGEGDREEIKQGLVLWTQDLIERHPTTTLDDIFVVVDPAHNDRIVSATLLIPQTWRYEEIPLSVGRPELVGTLPEYRGRGLVRALFDAVHERSASLGHQLQSITGISYFYRQFGYTMTVDLDDHATIPLHALDDAAADYKPLFTLRKATVDDIADLSTWYDYLARERLLSEMRSPEQWRHVVAGNSPGSLQGRVYLIIENAEGVGVGYVALAEIVSPHSLYCIAYVVGDQSSYLETFGDVIQGIKQWVLAAHGKLPALLYLDSSLHEALDWMITRTRGGNIRRQHYKWYLRVPEPIQFLQQIQPVLERRLEGSGAHRYTGELKVGFHNLKGMSLKFERGRITEIMSIQGKDGYDVRFPWNLFWNVVFGDQSNEEINALLPEVWPSSKGAVLLNTLFPKKKSWLEGLG
ncbi:MAG: GNAT family N-acetyltransferase [Caldilineaceae bacterium]|nr:GNAT family N-acetyltransferase [Caldilineaceae bacterium]